MSFVEIPIVSIKGSVIFPRSYMKIYFISPKYKRVGKILSEFPQNKRLFATIQKSEEKTLMNNGKVLGTICKLLDFQKKEDYFVGIVLGITPAEISLNKRINSIDYANYEVIEEIDDIPFEKQEKYRKKILRTLEMNKDKIFFKSCTERDLSILPINELTSQVCSYLEIDIGFKLELLGIRSLLQRTKMLIKYLEEIKPKLVLSNCDKHCNSN